MGQSISSSIQTVNSEQEIDNTDQPLPFVPTVPTIPVHFENRDMEGHYQRSTRLRFLLNKLPATREVQMEHSWNPEDSSQNIIIKADDRLTLFRHPIPQSTDSIRGKVGFTHGMHVWEVIWSTEQRGTHAVIGVATSEAPLHADNYQNLVGSNDQSWGWDLINNKLCHNSAIDPGIRYPSILQPEERYKAPEKILVVLDMDEGTLGFIAGDHYLGMAFDGLKGRTLYPIVSTVWARCEITMTYIGGVERVPLSLKDLSRHVIRQKLGRTHLRMLVEQLPLPKSLKIYLL